MRMLLLGTILALSATSVAQDVAPIDHGRSVGAHSAMNRRVRTRARIARFEVSGTLERRLVVRVVRVVRLHLRRLQLCYERQVHMDPNLEGVVGVRFFIEQGGVTSHIELESPRGFEEVAGCITRSFRTMRFPISDGTSTVGVGLEFRVAR